MGQATRMAFRACDGPIRRALGPILRDGGAFYALTGRTYCAAC